jgi:uncharacterized protein involved in exopolysaccharide biosynthesis
MNSIERAMNKLSQAEPVAPGEQPITRQTHTLTGQAAEIILAGILRQKYTILLPCLLAIITVAIVVHFTSPLYQAHASLLFNWGHEYMYRSEVGGDSGSWSAFRFEQIINSEMEILNSRDLKERVINSIGIDKLYPEALKVKSRNITPMDIAVENFSKNLSIQSIKNSNVMYIYYLHPDSKIALHAIDLIIRLFIDKHFQVFSNSRVDFLEGMLNDSHQNLIKAQDALQTFKQMNRIFNIDEQIRLSLGHLTNLEDSLRSTKSRIDELKQRIASLEVELPQIPKNDKENDQDPQVNLAKQKLLELSLKEQDLLSKYNEDSRFITSVKQEIEQVKLFLQKLESQKKEISRGTAKLVTNKTFWDVRLELSRLRAEQTSLQVARSNIEQQLNEANTRLMDINNKKKELGDLERDVDIQRANYTDILKKVEEARALADLERQRLSNIRIIQPPIVSFKPIGASISTKILVAAIMGLLVGFILAFYYENRKGLFNKLVKLKQSSVSATLAQSNPFTHKL